MDWSTGQDLNLRIKALQAFSLNHSDTRAYGEPGARFALAKFLRPGVDTYFDFSRQAGLLGFEPRYTFSVFIVRTVL